MVRKSTATLLLAVLAAMGVVSVAAEPAGADPIDWLARGVPEWAYESAESINNACLNMWDVSTDVMGSGSSSLAFVGLPAAAPGGLTLGAIATSGSIVAIAGATGLAAATALGVGCSTIKLGNTLFPQVFAEYDGPPETFDHGGMRPCQELEPVPAGSQLTDMCFRFTVPAGLPAGTNVKLGLPCIPDSTGVLSRCVSGGAELRLRSSTGSLTSNGIGVTSGQQTTVVIPCASVWNHCGWAWNDFTPAFPGLMWGMGLFIEVRNDLARFALASETWAAQGRLHRLRATVDCKRPSDGHTTQVRKYSATFWQDEDSPAYPEIRCPTGYGGTSVELLRQGATFGGVTPSSWATVDTHLDWDISPTVLNNPQSFQCWIDGLTNCPIVELDPANPGADRRLGGPQGVQMSPSSPTLGTETIPKLIELAPWPETDPELNPNPTTTAVPTTVPSTTAPPTTQPPEDPCVPGAPSSAGCTPIDTPSDPDAETGECFPTGWGLLNPVEWVLKPVKCALLWAFWDQDAADEISGLGRDHGWSQLVADSELSTSTATAPCIDMDVADICPQQLLELEAPPWVSVLVGAVVSFFALFEAVGIFSRITRT